MVERDLLFGEISRERSKQDAQWGGAIHDDSHEPWEWCAYIGKHNLMADSADTTQDYEARMIKIAALAIAAIESSRRKRQ